MAGNDTIGYGHLLQGVSPGATITQQQADDLLAEDVAKVDACLAKMLKVSILQDQWDALADFAYNLGCEALASSTLMSLVNRQQFSAAAGQFSRWVFAAQQVLPDLVRRRRDEAEMFMGVLPVRAT
jgi:lysozyme